MTGSIRATSLISDPNASGSVRVPEYKLVQECVDQYRAKRDAHGNLDIRIRVPKRFASLWLLKLSELYATDAELEELDEERKR